ncbi:MAG: dTDP-4-dehydrorhamnose reductase [Phycisphaerales bacterium]|nr:MAG: dTDP-4-dehydrorhamnose reductase [Phycisphaerales bacterium]
MSKDVVAILGAKGMLGVDLTAACRAKGYDVRVHDLPEFDITNPARVRDVLCQADAVINCAAYTDVDGAETHAELAHRVNGEAVGQLGAFAREHGKWVLHFSTDFVFSGTLDRPYVETDVPQPINEYGRSKLAGEQLLEASDCAHCTARLEWTYGAHGTNFVTKLIEQAFHGGTLQVVDDQIGSPTATTVVAAVACDLLEHRAEGTFHLASTGYVSRFGIAQFVVERLGLGVNLQPCRSSDYAVPATRPLNSRFDCSKIHALLGHQIEPWQTSLEHFLRQLDETDSHYRRCGIHRQ